VAYLSNIISVMCVVIGLVLILALMPMPYCIFTNAVSEPKTRRGDVLSASLLLLRSRLPPCSAVLLLRVPSVEAQCARAWPQVCAPVRLPVGLPLPPALVPTTGPAPPCGYRRGLTQVYSVPPLRLRAAVATHLSSDTEAPLSWT
jgi:hypothetical protein